MPAVDFTGVSSGFEIIPEGQYDCTVFAVEQKVSQNSGAPYLNWQLKIQGGDFDGRRMFYVTSLQPQSLWVLKLALKAIGYSDEQLKGQFNLDLEELCGRECVAVVVHEEYKGEMRDHVDKILASTSGGDTAGAALYR